jgi:hypothetical protein
MSATGRDPDPDLDALLTLYAAGTLSPEERVRVEAAAGADPAVARELAYAVALAAGLRASEAEGPPVRSPGELGLRRLEREIERDATTASAAPAAPTHGVRDRPVARLALAAGVALAVGLGVGALGTLQLAGPSYRLAGSPAETAQGPAEGPELLVAFRAEARAAELEALLRDLELELAGGPSALGLYRVRAPAEAEPARVIDALRARNDLVAEASPTP